MLKKLLFRKKRLHGRSGGMVNVFYKKKLTLFPPKSFVENIGMDNSGIHSINTQIIISPN